MEYSRIKAVPATKYALGIVGLAAAIALIERIDNSFVATVPKVVALIVLMALFVIFSGLAQSARKKSDNVGAFVMWPVAILFVVACIFVLTSIFFEWPQLHSPFSRQNLNVRTVTEGGTSRDTLPQHARKRPGVDIKVTSSPGATIINGDSNKVSR